MEHARLEEIEAKNIFSQQPQISFEAPRQGRDCRALP